MREVEDLFSVTIDSDLWRVGNDLFIIVQEGWYDKIGDGMLELVT